MTIEHQNGDKPEAVQKVTKLAATARKITCPKCGAKLRLPEEQPLPSSDCLSQPPLSVPLQSPEQSALPRRIFWTKRRKVIIYSASALVVMGALVSALLFRGHKASYDWLEIERGVDGRIVSLWIDPGAIPKETLRSLPRVEDKKKLAKQEVKELAEKYGLFDTRSVNPHLVFDDFAIEWWSQRERVSWELELEFLSRRMVLDVAERDKIVIPAHGDLSYLADKLLPILMKKSRET